MGSVDTGSTKVKAGPGIEKRWAWWLMLKTSTIWRGRQEDQEFKASLCYIRSLNHPELPETLSQAKDKGS